MCANCGPADYNYDETLSTLRYANRAKNIKNKPKINEDPKDAMLREYQEEIKRLKEQLQATGRGVMIDENGREMQVHDAKREIVEKIVEREVIKEVKVGISDAEMESIRKKADEEKQMLMKQAQDDMKQLIEQQSRTAQERAELQKLFDLEAEDRKRIEEQKQKLQSKLKMMEEKLIKGGEVISKASQQEAMLRKAEKELRERQAQEARLARELAEKEEANLQLEEHFSSLQEEVEVKTKKLKKLWTKFQTAQREVEDLQSEFQLEKTDLLETIRQLSRTVKLKELIIANFIPEDYAKKIEKRAVWNHEEDSWNVSKIELSGNKIRALRPMSNGKLRRPETDFAKQRKQYDSNPRYKYDNIAGMDLDMPEKTTQEFDGPGMVARIDPILAMAINDEDDDDDVIFTESGIANPYMQYNNDAGPSQDDDRERRKSKSGKSGGTKEKKRDSERRK
jgi:kinesin family protein 3/17